MNDQGIVDLQRHLAKQVDLVSRSATVDDLTRSASSIASGLTPDEQAAAAMLYILRLLKDQHRQVVVATERAAETTRPRRVRFEDTLPADDPYFVAKAERDEAFRRGCVNLLDDFIRRQRVQWTAELLSSTFALPDGTLVAWGAATVEQHEMRRAMFLGNAQANLEGAARHEQAIRDLREARAATLSDLVSVAVA